MKKKSFAIIGNPITHSLSPVLHNYWFKKYKIDEFKSLYTFYYSGFNIRSSDFNANLGINQLKKIKNITKIRFKNFIQDSFFTD